MGSWRKGEKVSTLGGSSKPHRSWRELWDVLQHQQAAWERRAEDCAFVPGCYCLTREPNKGKASCLHKRKRFPGLEMGLCGAAKPTHVCLSPNNSEGWGQNHLRAEGHMHILNPSKYANVWCWLKRKEIGFEFSLFALSFTWAGKEELGTWAATRQWCSYRKPVLTLVAGGTGGEQPVPKSPREDTKLHLLRPQRNE